MRRLFLFFIIIVLLAAVGCQSKTPAATEVAPTAASGGASSPIATASVNQGRQQLLVLPDDGPGPVLDLIDGARKSIRFKIYLLTYNDARQALIRAAKRGVDVQVLIDKNPVGGGESNADSYRRLKSAGVTVKWAPAVYKNTHEKSLVIDDQIALMATFNFTNSSFKRNREYAVITTEPEVVAQVAAVFEADWAGKDAQLPAESPLVLSPENSRERLTRLIDQAQQRLWLEEATLQDDDITDALVQAARRGVDVRFLAPERNDNDHAADNLAKLTAAGAQVARLDRPYIHAKVILADDRAFVGSENLTFTSLELNRELGIITADRAVTQRLAQTFQHDWKLAAGDSAATPGQGPIAIDWQDAAAYAGQEVIVTGEIVHTYDSGKVTFLNFDEDYRNTLTLVIFPDLYHQFPQKPARYFQNRRVQVRGVIKMYEGKPEIVIDDPEQINTLGDNARVPTLSPTAASPPALAADAVAPWQKAGDYVGQEVTIRGEVVRSYRSDKVIFLNFDEDWRGKFSLVIFASDFARFPQPPETAYLHQTIQARGKIKLYKGAPEMIIASPEQIEIVVAAATPTPVPAQGLIPWQQAADYVGQEGTVAGRIVKVKDIGRITFLDFSTRPNAFVALIYAEDYDRFPQTPAQLYQGKQVWITGEISSYRGAPQIVVHSPEQIEVFGD